MLTEQARILTQELGKLKGSAMKVGQLLALYGEHMYLPPEVVDILRTLQDDSPPLDWLALQPVLKRELGAARLREMEIDPEPLAAASLGQVHRARRLRDDRLLCIKIQYPGVAEAIDSDLNTVGTLLLLSRMLPQGFDLNEMLGEIRKMLRREVDYRSEATQIQAFRDLLSSDPRFCVPEIFPEYCTARVLTMSYEPGLNPDSAAVRELSLERRNRLAEAALELFLREFFRWNRVQTDPHFGNYRVRLDPQGRTDRWVLLDFGAVCGYSQDFLTHYHEMIRGALWQDRERLRRAAVGLGFMPANASAKTWDDFAAMCALIVEPFSESIADGNPTRAQGAYRWGASELPQRVAVAASKASLSYSFRLPPKEFVFLHRKLGGVFILLAKLNAEFSGRNLLLEYLS